MKVCLKIVERLCQPCTNLGDKDVGDNISYPTNSNHLLILEEDYIKKRKPSCMITHYSIRQL